MHDSGNAGEFVREEVHRVRESKHGRRTHSGSLRSLSPKRAQPV